MHSPFWKTLLQAVEDEVEEIHMTCDLLFPKTAAEVRKMMDYVNYHKMWVPTQVSHLIFLICLFSVLSRLQLQRTLIIMAVFVPINFAVKKNLQL